jgi:DNA-3-methyladenine glycosylase I
MNTFHIVSITADDRPWISALLTEHWGAPEVVSHGKVWNAAELPGFIAVCNEDGARCGLVTYRLDGDECEVVSLDSLRERMGIGAALLEAVHEIAREAGCRRVWLISTNDNLHALRFYQKRGYRLAALYPNEMEQSRKLKPSIPLIGMDEIPLRDAIEFEYPLA